MSAPSSTTSSPASESASSELSRVYVEGIVAGVIGAATVAVWFFVLDIFDGRPFRTPNLLGAAIFRPGVGSDSLQTLPVSAEMVLVYTWVHGMAFCAIGGVAAKLFQLGERNVNLGFGIVLLFVIFEFGFIAAAFIFAEPILHALAWPAVLFGNLLAAAAMGAYFLRRHPNLSIQP